MILRFVLPLPDTGLQVLMTTHTYEKSLPCIAAPMPSC